MGLQLSNLTATPPAAACCLTLGSLDLKAAEVQKEVRNLTYSAQPSIYHMAALLTTAPGQFDAVLIDPATTTSADVDRLARLTRGTRIPIWLLPSRASAAIAAKLHACHALPWPVVQQRLASGPTPQPMQPDAIPPEPNAVTPSRLSQEMDPTDDGPLLSQDELKALLGPTTSA